MPTCPATRVVLFGYCLCLSYIRVGSITLCWRFSLMLLLRVRSRGKAKTVNKNFRTLSRDRGLVLYKHAPPTSARLKQALTKPRPTPTTNNRLAPKASNIRPHVRTPAHTHAHHHPSAYHSRIPDERAAVQRLLPPLGPEHPAAVAEVPARERPEADVPQPARDQPRSGTVPRHAQGFSAASLGGGLSYPRSFQARTRMNEVGQEALF